MMGLFDVFRRRPPIRDLPGLADFIDQNAAFLVQKGIYEYSRARAGHYSKVLFSEPLFQEAIERSRWGAYPLGLAMVAEAVETVLGCQPGYRRDPALATLSSLVVSVFDRYPAPATLDPSEWSEARSELQRRLELIRLHVRKPAKDIPEPFAEAYFALIPIEKKLRASEFPTIRNYLRVSLCNIHADFSERADVPVLVTILSAGSPE
jgi:hypothetical protein